MLPGLVERGSPVQTYLRLCIWGLPKTGKSVLAATFPSPLFVNPIVESGYDTLKTDVGRLVDCIPIGRTHSDWLQEQGGDPVTKELEDLVQRIYLLKNKGELKWRTLVIGGLSVLQRLVILEAEKAVPKSHYGHEDVQGQWMYVAKWATRFIQNLFALPMHIILEVSAKENRDRSGEVVDYQMDLQGSMQPLIKTVSNVVCYQAAPPGTYLTSFTPSKKYFATSRLPQLNFGQPIQNCSYDHFAKALGLPNICEADPEHPRCTGKWIWGGHWKNE